MRRELFVHWMPPQVLHGLSPSLQTQYHTQRLGPHQILRPSQRQTQHLDPRQVQHQIRHLNQHRNLHQVRHLSRHQTQHPGPPLERPLQDPHQQVLRAVHQSHQLLHHRLLVHLHRLHHPQVSLPRAYQRYHQLLRPCQQTPRSLLHRHRLLLPWERLFCPPSVWLPVPNRQNHPHRLPILQGIHLPLWDLPFHRILPQQSRLFQTSLPCHRFHLFRTHLLAILLSRSSPPSLNSPLRYRLSPRSRPSPKTPLPTLLKRIVAPPSFTAAPARCL
mmetsp:Transcript_26795/g.62273  ORF Transcript_26795/g.62273 Transcript_26795/m.62273 type:complete len:274 (-) Transcript_26795:587-1408(-)